MKRPFFIVMILAIGSCLLSTICLAQNNILPNPEQKLREYQVDQRKKMEDPELADLQEFQKWLRGQTSTFRVGLSPILNMEDPRIGELWDPHPGESYDPIRMLTANWMFRANFLSPGRHRNEMANAIMGLNAFADAGYRDGNILKRSIYHFLRNRLYTAWDLQLAQEEVRDVFFENLVRNHPY